MMMLSEHSENLYKNLGKLLNYSTSTYSNSDLVIEVDYDEGTDYFDLPVIESNNPSGQWIFVFQKYWKEIPSSLPNQVSNICRQPSLRSL